MADHIASRKPISAPIPPIVEENESEPTAFPEDKWEEDASYQTATDYDVRAEAASYIANARQAVEAAPRMREMMRVSNRFNYSQYYLLPARVGIRVLDQVMDEMFREGCSLTDIQVTFELTEVGNKL